ncbi:MAG: cupin domain-containing protein [Desulfovibrio sp.]|nr:cupin domain-containing protein [Desulfovibrio sp.]
MPQAPDIGSRVRAFREEKELLLEDLSLHTKLSVEFLEKLEKNEVYPSIGPMQKVARALGVRLGTFLDDQFTQDPIRNRIEEGASSGDDPMHSGLTVRPTYVYQALGKGKTDRNMEPFYIEIFPDPSVEEKTSSHQGEEFILVLKGKLLVIYGHERHVLSAGETIYYNSIVPHFVGAADDAPVTILAVTYNPQ